MPRGVPIVEVSPGIAVCPRHPEVEMYRQPRQWYCWKCGALYRQRRRKDHINDGACQHCSNPALPGLVRCAYHDAYVKSWSKAKSKEQHREHNLRMAYGITSKQKEDMWLAQDKRCAICGTEIVLWGHGRGSAYVDHVHDTDPIIVRGLLCQDCNMSIGGFKEDIGHLVSAIRYLGGEPCPKSA